MKPHIGTVVVNTADDTIFFGLHISPDVDTIIYSMAGIGDDTKGWGIKNDTYNALEMLALYGLETWFKIGDKDLATHVFRTMRLRQGATLTQVTAEIAEKLGVKWRILPMTDDRVQTMVETENGLMPFQTYFVKHGHRPKVFKVIFDGVENAKPSTEVRRSIKEADYLVICPSNPILSINPILSLKGVREMLRQTSATVLAVSPIVGGRAFRGPAAELLKSMGFEASPAGVAAFYRDFLDILVMDETDAEHAEEVRAMGIKPVLTNTVMTTFEDKVSLAKTCLQTLGWRS